MSTPCSGVILYRMSLTGVSLQYAEKLYGIDSADDKPHGTDEGEADIEAEIQQELSELKKPKEKPLFANVRMDIQCGMYAILDDYLRRSAVKLITQKKPQSSSSRPARP